MQDSRLYQLLHKELTDDISQAEIAELNSLKTQPNFDSVKSDVSRVWTVSKEYFPKKSFDVDAAKARFRERITQDLQPQPATVAPSMTAKSVWPIRSLIGIAAALILIATASYFYFNNNEVKKTQTYEQVDYAVLDDESEVWLSENASITVGDFSTENLRAVKLDGEAKFKVSSDPAKKFIVDLGNGNYIEVIGTQFTAVSDNGQSQSTVSVEEGKVRFYNTVNKDLDVLLTGGQSAIIDNSDKSLVKATDPMAVKKKLSFNNTPLPEVFKQLADSYNVKFDFVEDQIAKCRFTSPLIKNYTIHEIIEVIINVKQGDFPEFSIVESLSSPNQYTVSGIDCK